MNNFKPKFFTLLSLGFNKEQLSKDVFSGIVVGIVALPLAIAFAVASGVSPEKGIITAVVAGFIISFLGGSRVQIGGPTGAFIIIVSGIVKEYGVSGLMISTIMAGIILVILGLLGLGNLLRYIPHPLIVGFTTAIAMVIFTTQIKDAFGLEIAEVPSEFIHKWGAYFSNFHTINIYALVVTLITILIAVFSGRIVKKIPGSFIAIVLVTLVVVIFKIPVYTIESFFGDISGSVSLSIPVINSINDLSIYIKPAVTIALLGAIESLLSAVVADGMIGGNHRSNTELIAQGIANIVTPFFGGIPATGAIARTATNIKNGGRTPVAGIVHAITLLLIMIFLSPLAKLIPMSCLAGVLIVVSYNMSEWRTFIYILKGFKSDAVILATTFLLTLLVDLTVAIEVGIVMASIFFMRRMANSWNISAKDEIIDEIDAYDIPDEIGIYEISGPLFFATAKEYIEIIKKSGFKYKVLILRMRHVPFIDATGSHNLKDIVNLLNKEGIVTVVSGVNNSVKKECEKIIENCFDDFNAALDFARKNI